MPVTVGGLRRYALAAFVCLAVLAAADAKIKTRKHTTEPAAPADGRVTDIRFWSLGDATRIAVEVSTDFQFRSDRLSAPDRIFYDISGVKPSHLPKGIETILVRDAFVKQIRVAEVRPGTTRIVLDLFAHVEAKASQLSNPSRLMIELRPVQDVQDKGKPPAEGAVSATQRSEPPAERPASSAPAAAAKLPAPKVDLPAMAPNPVVQRAAEAATPQPSAPVPPDPKIAAKISAAAAVAPNLDTEGRGAPGAKADRKQVEAQSASAAKRNSAGEQSMTRALGLKLRRVVLDAGHGGHDSGTRGPSGFLEKDLVLDVATRLGALIESRLGSEVIYTRSDDTFIALEERTRIANRHNADLFLSIHANSSPVKTTSGIETYYLNFTQSKGALELAARENATSERSIYDLHDLVQRITLNDKLGESREFAARIQASLSTLSARTNTKSKDRGVRKAPFVVLIGASMPSVLAEIGFVSNPHDEALMKKPEYRQRIAEALYKGIAQYASSLSHFQVARQKPAE